MALRALDMPTKPHKRTKGLRLDLGAGQNVREGFAGVDIAPGPGIEYVVDLFAFPWPFEDGSVIEAHMSHVAEHIPHYRPEWDRDGWWMWFDELYRITKPGAKISIIHPYVKSDRAFWDPTHVRFIHETTWYYLDAQWRKAQGLDHYPVSADFEVVVISGNGIADTIATRPAEFQAFSRQHYWNVLADLVVELKRR